MKLDNKINVSLSLLLVVLLFSAFGLLINKLVPQFNEHIFSKSLDDQIKLFLEIIINLLLIYGVIMFFTDYMRESLMNIFNLNNVDSKYLFFLNELFIFVIVILNNNSLLNKIKKFINNLL